MIRRSSLVVAVVVAFVAGGAAWASTPFTDIAGNTHEANIDAIYSAGITSGCDGTHYCPNNPVTRAQMATFLARVAGVGKNLPRTNGRSDRQSYCAMAKANPGAFPLGPCSETEVGMSIGEDFDFAIGADGFPIFSSQDVLGELVALHCTDPICGENSGGPVSVIDHDSAGTGGFSAIAVGPDGVAIVSYYDAQNHDLRVVACNGHPCDGRDAVTTVDATGDVGRDTAITFGADGRAIVSYYDKTNGQLKVAHCNNHDCTTSFLAVVDDGNTRGAPHDVGAQSSIAIGTDGFPIIAYRDATDSSLRVSHCTSVLCTGTVNTRTIGAADPDAQTTSITIGVDGLPVVAFKSSDKLLVAHCPDVACGASPTISTVDGGVGQPEVGASPSIAIAADGKPMLAYKNVTDHTVMFAHCSTVDCGGNATVTELDAFALSTSWTIVRLGLDGVPLVGWSINAASFIKRVPVIL